MKAWLSKLYIQVLIGLILGAAIGYFLPDFGIKLQPLADGFIRPRDHIAVQNGQS